MSRTTARAELLMTRAAANVPAVNRTTARPRRYVTRVHAENRREYPALSRFVGDGWVCKICGTADRLVGHQAPVASVAYGWITDIECQGCGVLETFDPSSGATLLQLPR